ncbi:hypothetical protein AAG570_006920 [Ranatra chinensis]|uniref:Uncharacterized protein n=1 Tax=Ranatra chinensis TaxID=642074 RepID=A0ABD0ZGN3_9HEMI
MRLLLLLVVAIGLFATFALAEVRVTLHHVHKGPRDVNEYKKAHESFMSSLSKFMVLKRSGVKIPLKNYINESAYLVNCAPSYGRYAVVFNDDSGALPTDIPPAFPMSFSS